ncbi:MAG: radical SAM protein [Desulfovibrionaceae bacterium]|nr:radical SAM protein [Desulfovibrionaceae bacterium]
MHFTSGINRPPFEANSGYLQVTSGCSHASCSFCSYFKDTPFKKSPIAEIEADVRQIPKYFGEPERIFLQGADGFAADYEILMQTAELIHKYVPSVKTIGGYARIDNFVHKTLEELKNIVSVGYADPYIGVESGDDVILKRINKGYNAAMVREQLEKLTLAGMPCITNFLNGLGGAGYGLDHARKTAQIYKDINISLIEVSSLTLIPGTPLFRQKEKGKFKEALEHERLRDMQEFILNLSNQTVFLSDHISVPFRVKANLPSQKQELIAGLEELINKVPEAELLTHRQTAQQYF